MLSRIALAIFTTSTFLTPLQVSLAQAQESGEKACSLVTEVNSDGAVVWSENTDIASLVTDAKLLEISAADYQTLCDGEEVNQIASSVTDAVDNGDQTSQTEKSSDDEATKTASSSFHPLFLAPLGIGIQGTASDDGSSSSSTFLDETTTYTYDAALDNTWTARQEYKNVAQYFSTSTINPYTLIGVNNAYARGLSGTGKTIAIVDTDYHSGTHLEIVDKSNAGKVSIYGALTYGNATDGWHGVHVAGTAASDYNGNSSSFTNRYTSGAYPLLNYGTMGVAYAAGLHISDFATSESGSYNKHRASATSSAKSAGAIVQNNSWGTGNCKTSTGCAYTIDVALTRQANNGTSDSQTLADWIGDSASNHADYISAFDSFQETGVVVFSAGNDENSTEVNVRGGLPLLATELAEAWLVVGNLDVSGSTISSSSVSRKGNQCGQAAEFCIYADGEEITAGIGNASSSTNDSYDVYSGTSMAAPMVSGAVALLSEAFPNHTPAQLTDRLLASANNDFFTATGTTSFINGVTHGFNAEYGHGLLDLATALGPISTSSMIPPSDGFGLRNTRFGNIETARRFALSSSQVQLGAAFGDSIQNTLNGRKAYFYDALNGGFAFDMGSLVKSQPITASKSHSFDSLLGGNTILRHQRENGFSFISDKSQGDSVEGSMMAFLPVSPTTTSFVGKNIHMQNAMSFTQRGANSDFGVNSTSPFNIPFIQASEQGTTAGNKWAIGDGILSFGLFEGDEVNYGLNTTGFVADYGREIGSTHTSVFFGGTNEEDGFLATSVEGAFAETSKANTTFAGISSYGWLNSDWSYNALGSVGSTALDVEGVGLLNDINDVTSTSLAFEMARSVGLNEHDSVHIGISQPLRVESGNATIMVPQLYDQNGSLNFSQASTDLSPSGRQLDLSFGYQAKLHDAFDVGVQFAVSQDYGHVQSKKLANSAFAFMKVAF